MSNTKRKLRIAFVVGEFPLVSETFIINQIADLMERGMEVTIFAFKRGDQSNCSQKFHDYHMSDAVHYLEAPIDFFVRSLSKVILLIRLLLHSPALIINLFKIGKTNPGVLPLQLLFWSTPFLNRKFDLVHCHFGPVANKYLVIKDFLGLKEKIITTFYGYDVSLLFKNKPSDYYDNLKRESSLFFVMSNNMKERIVKQGFDSDKVKVLPVSIDVKSYPYQEREIKEGETIKILSVGRFVEKKGFDDLLRALAIVREKSNRAFKCSVIGGGSLKDTLLMMTNRLHLQDAVEYKGYMKIENIIKEFCASHVFIQPSKTARNGDME